ncbi:MAG: hypothetical protein AAGE92_06015, partial [Cyanobacteria bacterium P01_G01_bin.4]
MSNAEYASSYGELVGGLLFFQNKVGFGAQTATARLPVPTPSQAIAGKAAPRPERMAGAIL